MSSEGASFRITDVDREAAVGALGEHYATGRLDKAEHDECTDLVWSARTDSDEAKLFVDLSAPHGGVVMAAAPSAVAGTGRDAQTVRDGLPFRHRGPFGPWLPW